MLDMTVIILTKNEECNIKKCIESVNKLASRIVVMDSFSTDNTVQYAKEMGADVYQHEFKHYGAQFQYALDNCEINTKWVFRLDADEEVSPESFVEISNVCIENADTDINGFVFRLSETFMGTRLRHAGDLGVLKKLCIFKYGTAYMENRYMGEHLILTEGKTKVLKTLSYHNDFKGWSFYINKLNWYASREAKDYFDKLKQNNEQSIVELDTPTRIRRILKYKIYYHLPQRLRASITHLN